MYDWTQTSRESFNPIQKLNIPHIPVIYNIQEIHECPSSVVENQTLLYSKSRFQFYHWFKINSRFKQWMFPERLSLTSTNLIIFTPFMKCNVGLIRLRNVTEWNITALYFVHHVIRAGKTGSIPVITTNLHKKCLRKDEFI